MIVKLDKNDYENVNGGMTLRSYKCCLPNCAEGGTHYEILLNGVEDFNQGIEVFQNIPELAEEIGILEAIERTSKIKKEIPRLTIGVNAQVWRACENELNRRGIAFSREND